MRLTSEERAKIKAALRACANGGCDPRMKALLSVHSGAVGGKLYELVYLDGLTGKEAAKRLYVSQRTFARLLERFYLRVWECMQG